MKAHFLMIATPAACHIPSLHSLQQNPDRQRGDFSATGHQYIMNDEPNIANVYAKIAHGPPFGTDLIFLRNEYLRPAHLK
jgi:hypothetical protein